MDTNLVLIEGVPGSGKSSTAQHLGFHLIRLGYQTCWFFETDENHPIYPITSSLPLEYREERDRSECKRTEEEVISGWRILADSLSGTDRVVILESSLFQTVIQFYLMLNRPTEEIFAHVAAVERVIEPLAPVLIYLTESDPAATLLRARRDRSADFADFLVQQFAASPFGHAHGIQDFAGVLQAYRTAGGIADDLFAAVRLRKVTLDTGSGDWQSRYNAITDFLRLASMECEESVEQNADMFVGTYRRRGSTDEYSVSLDGDSLYVSRQVRHRLIATTETTFYLEGTRIELKFRLGANKVAHVVEVSGPDPDLPQVWERIESGACHRAQRAVHARHFPAECVRQSPTSRFGGRLK
jgi:hypothetical protein